MAYILKISKTFSNQALFQNKTKTFVKICYEQNHNLADKSNETNSRTYENAFKDILMMSNRNREQPNRMVSFEKILVMKKLLKQINVTDDDMKKMNIVHVTGKDLLKLFDAFLTLRFCYTILFFLKLKSLIKETHSIT